MKVLLINDFKEGGGAETVFLSNLNYLKSEGKYEVESFVGSKTYTTPDGLLAYLFSFKHQSLLQNKLETYKPNIIHVHGYYHVLSASIFKAIRVYKKVNRNVKVIYTAHDYHFIYPNSALLSYRTQRPVIVKEFNLTSWLFLDKVDHRGTLYSLVKKAQWIIAHRILNIKREIDLFLCPSNFLKDFYQNELGVKTKMLRNPLETAEYLAPKKNIDGENFRLVYFL